MNINIVDLTPRGQNSYSADSMTLGVELEKAPKVVTVETPHEEWTFHLIGIVKDTDDVPIGYRYQEKVHNLFLTLYE